MLFLDSAHSTCSKLEMASGFPQAQILLQAAIDYSYPISVAFSQSSVFLSKAGWRCGQGGVRQCHSSSKPEQSRVCSLQLPFIEVQGPALEPMGSRDSTPALSFWAGESERLTKSLSLLSQAPPFAALLSSPFSNPAVGNLDLLLMGSSF